MILKEQQSSYRQIFKATSLFGGVQIFNIIISIIKSKFIAVLLGPAGMGVSGLFTATLNLIGSFTNFGLAVSAVRDIASADESGDPEKVGSVVAIIRKLVWVTGLFGLSLTFLFSSWLSELTFGNKEYSFAFILLSVTLLFNQLTSAQNVLMQGLRKLHDLAKANMLSSLLSLIFTIPIYYIYGLKGIVPGLIITSILTLLITSYFVRNTMICKISVPQDIVLNESRRMLKMGFLLSLSGLTTLGASYIVRIYISKSGDIADVGLYNAGFAIIGTYVGLVFNAMGTDYYPRLSGVSNNMVKTNQLINHQAELSVLILSPILCGFIIFINWVIILLYSSDFIPINGMVHWAALGMYFKAVSWSIGFILLAKGNSRGFFVSELLANSYLLLLNVLGYKFFGLNGLGMSFFIGYILYLFQIYILANYKYDFSFNSNFYRVFVYQFLFGLISFIIIKFINNPWNFGLGGLIIICSTCYSIIEMDKRIGIKEVLFKKFNKKQK